MKSLLLILLSVGMAYAQAPPPTSPAPASAANLAPVQIVMDDVGLKGSKFNTDKAEFRKPLVEMFEKAGFKVLPAKGTPPPEALQIRFMIAATHDGLGRIAFQISGRSSAGKDAGLKENPPGQPPRIRYGNIMAARSVFDEGLSEIHAILASLSISYFKAFMVAQGAPIPPVSFSVTYPLPPQATPLNPNEYSSISNLKIKSDGFVPPWPRVALERRTVGNVQVELLVGEDGKPVRAVVKQGPPELFLHALQWAMGYEFEPAMADGKPVKAKFLFNMNYKQDVFERYSIR
jgi:hypothetical protein